MYKLSTRSAGTTVCEGVGGLEEEKSSVYSVGKPSGPIAISMLTTAEVSVCERARTYTNAVLIFPISP